MLLYVKNNNPHFTYNKDEYKSYINKTEKPIIYINYSNKYKLLQILYNISFFFKVKNIKNPNKQLYIKSSNNIKNELKLLNDCMSSVDLMIKPSNVATPKMLSLFIKNMFKNNKNVKVKILSDKQLQKEGLNLIYSLGHGSANKPYFVIVERLTKNPTTCLVGKGITFDGGGINIKTSNGIYDMKLDKTGAIYALYAFKNIIENDNNTSIVCLLPFSENILSNSPIKSGDVIKSYNGKTVEVLDTDAEGRLILADALAYSINYNPSLLIDVATLTGSASAYNCYHSALFYTKSNFLKNYIEDISFKLNERMIGMPSWVKKNMLKSSVADIKNYSLECHDSFTATMFLHEFIPKNVKNWVHIDLAHHIYKNKEISIPNSKGFLTIIELIKKMNNHLKI